MEVQATEVKHNDKKATSTYSRASPISSLQLKGECIVGKALWTALDPTQSTQQAAEAELPDNQKCSLFSIVDSAKCQETERSKQRRRERRKPIGKEMLGHSATSSSTC